MKRHVSRLNISGIPIRTEVVLYPTPADTGIVVNILRILVEIHWWLLVALMTGVDCLVATSLVLVGYKFRTLAAYFGSLRQKYLQRSGENLDVLEKDFRKDFIAGIKFHKEILWIQRYLQYALGSTYSIQITESLLLLSITMIKMVALERNSTNLIANFSYISCVIALTGAYMLSGGNIMIEAEKIPKAIFYSGWEFTRSGKRLRSLIVVTIIRSQVPVFMTAFGIIMLSHNNFILILKNSYSFFAVMY
ncbi:uncharacterized protein LOC113236390 [Hyposmocoma kahamanoa]|uniref:uncharacterized protein LOC113236390 n=1 Tax=Hyposmocoma kahamanoa TaxID=1477025 RepID=UPI000E6D7FAA|nr:uncharacterized protein LOC113236390 [Hyposmocoma kahamanoa]